MTLLHAAERDLSAISKFFVALLHLLYVYVISVSALLIVDIIH